MRLTDKELSEFADYIPPSKYDMEGTLSALADECSRLRSLVKEMADKLECCASLYNDLQMFNGQAELNALVARAREVVK